MTETPEVMREMSSSIGGNISAETFNVLTDVTDKFKKEFETSEIPHTREVELSIIAPKAIKKELDRFENELKFFLLTADVVVREGDELKFTINQTDWLRCERCRNHRPVVGKNKYFPDLCFWCFQQMCGRPGQRRCYN